MPVKKISPALPNTLLGCTILDMEYQRGVRALVGSWSATLVSTASPCAVGDAVSLAGIMVGGVCTGLRDNKNGSWSLEGYDAGAELLRGVPPIEALSPCAKIKDAILMLAGHCDVACSFGGDGDLDVGNALLFVQGASCADAIMDLALLCGCVTYISNNGTLMVQPPGGTLPSGLDTVLSDSETIDIDGYATKSVVLLHRRYKPKEGQSTDWWWEGSTPSGSLTETTLSGNMPGGTYSMTIYEPIGAPKSEHSLVEESGMRQEYNATYEYATSTPLEVRDGQEWRIIKWALRHSTITKSTTKTLDALDPETGALVTVTFSETTTQETTRSVNLDGGYVSSETIVSKTVKSDEEDPNPAAFDKRVTRNVEISGFGQAGLVVETEETWVQKELGAYRNVQGANATYTVGGKVYPIGIKTHSTIGWMLETTSRVVREVYDESGACVARLETVHADEGTPDALRSGVVTPAESAAAAMSRIKNYQSTDIRMSIRPGSSAIPMDVSTVELPGRRQVFEVQPEDGSEIFPERWYIGDGLVAPVPVCPHFLRMGKRCRIKDIEGTMSGDDCPRGGRGWKTCPRAEEATGRASRSAEVPMDHAPVVGTAGSGSICTMREISVDKVLSDSEAEALAETLAGNILAVKAAGRGILRTVTVPLDTSIEPGGAVVGVTHSLKSLTSSVTYRDPTRPAPEYVFTRSSGMAAMEIFDKKISRTGRYTIGEVLGKDSASGDWNVKASNTVLRCASSKKHSVGDAVLVFLPPGSTQHGSIVRR